MYHGGPKRTKVCVLKINQVQLENVSQMPGISNIHSVSFEAETMKYWKYFNIGEGKEKKYVPSKLIADFTIQSPFEDFMTQGTIVPRKNKTNYKFPYYCETYSCDKSFDTLEELEAHILEGNHSLIPDTSSCDFIKSAYRQRASTDFKKFHVAPISTESVTLKANDTSSAQTFFRMGWALPQRKNGRLNEEARRFCVNKFLEGQRTGKKYSPEQIVELMKESRDGCFGKAMFSSSQLLTVKQVKSLLSRLASLQQNSNTSITNSSTMPDANTLLHLLPTVRNHCFMIKLNETFLFSDRTRSAI